jgi:glyceraldehyde-3-phosphate dehydrogenase/erythrose-4-phosphate dehydrogenase
MNIAERDPARLPWREKQVDVVLESTGKLRRTEDAARHPAADDNERAFSMRCIDMMQRMV